ncbi:uncharacterized protein LOC114522095 [Dendronephthya gigantea]|uniref:uncharacterized protein LOC114522095 n=1 Tax=Dendronephthya gigantea TaxID=151771 RepID=UPI001068F79E|nr:uncharacterized protein LOC114522095 [Dendronephthya gigantea]
MPRGKATSKSATKTDADETLPQSSAVEVKEIELTDPVDIISGGEGTCRLSKESELPNDISNVSAGANTSSNEGGDNSPPRKPKRLLAFTGSRKKDAKRGKSGDKTETSDNNKSASPRVGEPQSEQQSNKAEGKDLIANEKKKVACQSYRRQFFDDEHAYEDPSQLVNNSATRPQVHANEQNHLEKSKNERKTGMESIPSSPTSVKAGLSKSTESIKAAVKGLKEGHASMLSETSIPRSIFAALVALLLSLIVFLAVYFLLHSHAVLSIAVAILVYVVIFVSLGFMDGRRVKCLVLLLLPSAWSQAGRLALYVLLGYFAITGPLCNMVGNVKTVGNSVKCVNNERPDMVERIAQTFGKVQRCVTQQRVRLSKMNNSLDIECLEQRCSITKEQFKLKCEAKDYNIAPTMCKLSQNISCSDEPRFTQSPQDCHEKLRERFCQTEFQEILEFLDEVGSDDDGCGFLEIISMLFPLLILLVLYEGYKYEKNYRTFNSFHNFFLTGHFQVIDQSRSSCDRNAVLPLKKVELRKHVRPGRIGYLTDSEKHELWKNLRTYLTALLIVLFLILADLYMFRIFDLDIDRRAKLNTDLPSTNISKLPIDMNKTNETSNKTSNETSNKTMVTNNVTGKDANTTLAPTTSYKLDLRNEHDCMVNVDPPSSISKIILPIVLILVVLVIALQAHVTRLRWYICSRLYQMREKERVFYLYNKILEDRVKLGDDCRKRMKCYHREMETLKSLEITRVLAGQAPWLAKIFNFFHINSRQCIICKDTEKPEFKMCHGLDCSGVYCLTCSFDIDKKCLYCDTELKHSLSVNKADGKDLSSKESLV